MAISAQDVKTLREMTNVGMMDCKKALVATDGDMDKAVEWLREKGLAAAASIPNNLVQAAIGIVLSVLLYTALSKVPEIHKAFWKGE